MISGHTPVNIVSGLLRKRIQGNEEDNTRVHCPMAVISFHFLEDKSEYNGSTHTA